MAKEEIIMTATNVQDLRKVLEAIDVQQYLDWKENSEGKMLAYLPWQVATKLMYEHCPTMERKLICFDDDGKQCQYGNPYKILLNPGMTSQDQQRKNYKGYFVYTEVTCFGVTRGMQLYIMNDATEAITNPDHLTPEIVNKSIQRCFVKNYAEFGLGVDVYLGKYTKENSDKSKGKQQTWTEPEQPKKDTTPIVDKPTEKNKTVQDKPASKEKVQPAKSVDNKPAEPYTGTPITIEEAKILPYEKFPNNGAIYENVLQAAKKNAGNNELTWRHVFEALKQKTKRGKEQGNLTPRDMQVCTVLATALSTTHALL